MISLGRAVGRGNTDLSSYPGRLALQQRVLPAYRTGFLEALAEACEGGLTVFAGEPGREETILPASQLRNIHFVKGRNRHLVKASSPYYFLWQAGLLRWLEEWNPDALVMEANPRYFSTWAAIRWMQARGRRVIGWGLGFEQPGNRVAKSRPARLWQKGIRRKFLQSFDALIAYSQRGAEEYRTIGFPAQRVFVARNAVASRPAQPPPERSPELSHPATVLFVGRLQGRKRLDNLLRACAALPASLQPRLWIVGDGPAYGEYKALSQAIYPSARFFGARHGQEIRSMFASADLFVLPGTGGLAVQEAMAYALPVIVAEGDGTQQDLVRPENGWLVPPGDVQALTSAIQEALADINRLRKMGVESYRTVAEEVNIENMVSVFIEALRAVERDDRV